MSAPSVFRVARRHDAMYAEWHAKMRFILLFRYMRYFDERNSAERARWRFVPARNVLSSSLLPLPPSSPSSPERDVSAQRDR